MYDISQFERTHVPINPVLDREDLVPTAAKSHVGFFLNTVANIVVHIEFLHTFKYVFEG